jgi:iron complex transport system substrate-binding protein
MLWLLNILHPDIYSAEDFIAEAAEFYATYYGFDMDPAIIAG